MVVIDAIILKGKLIIIPKEVQKQLLSQLHNNHMGIAKNETTST